MRVGRAFFLCHAQIWIVGRVPIRSSASGSAFGVTIPLSSLRLQMGATPDPRALTRAGVVSPPLSPPSPAPPPSPSPAPRVHREDVAIRRRPATATWSGLSEGDGEGEREGHGAGVRGCPAAAKETCPAYAVADARVERTPEPPAPSL